MGGDLGDIRFRCHVMKLGIFPCFQEFERRGRIRGRRGGLGGKGEKKARRVNTVKIHVWFALILEFKGLKENLF